MGQQSTLTSQQTNLMFMTNNVFIDSSILVEYIKGSKTALLNSIISKKEVVPYINEIVVSELLLYFLSVNGNAAPRTLKSGEKIGAIFQEHSNYKIIQRFAFPSK